MKFLIVDSYYKEFQTSFYQHYSRVAQRSYAEHWRVLMDECFGTADFYSFNLVALGHEATEVVANDESLQRHWVAEHDIKIVSNEARWARLLAARARHAPLPPDWFYPILTAQVQLYHPDVLYVQEMNSISTEWLTEIKSLVRMTVGQIAAPVSPRANFKPYDLVLTSFPHFVERFRQQGLKSEYLRLAFEPRVLERLGDDVPRHRAVFIGGLSRWHAERVAWLECIACTQPLDVWGYGADMLSSLLRARHRGEAWALDMYRLLRGADLALNQHIKVAENFANNMRLFEATGLGTLLITDHKDNLADLFEPGKEVVAYRSADECAELVGYYLAHDAERQAIARAGQARTLHEHTYAQRMRELVQIIQKYLR